MERRIDRAGITGLLEELIDTGTATAVVALLGEPDQVLWAQSAGRLRRNEASPKTRVSTRFDFASLTKPLVATLALRLDGEGILPLATPVGDLWPAAHRDLASQPLSELLRHRSGLAPWAPLYRLCRSREEVLGRLLDGRLLGAKPGTYSDLGYILYGMAAELRTGETLRSLLRSYVLAHPLWMSGVAASPGDRPNVAESRLDTGKEVELAAGLGMRIEPLGPPPVGLPQDGNARFLGGLRGGVGVTEGHAGLFGRAQDLWRLGAEWLEPKRLLQQEKVAEALGGEGPYALGWERATRHNSAGPALRPSAFGHTGFTGGSLWIDPEARRVLVLLMHRADPTSDMNTWRRRFHTLAQTSAAPSKRIRTEATL